MDTASLDKLENLVIQCFDSAASGSNHINLINLAKQWTSSPDSLGVFFIFFRLFNLFYFICNKYYYYNTIFLFTQRFVLV